MKVSAVEQETIIIWNRGEDTAYVFTYEPKWKRRLEQLGCECVMDNGCGGKEYAIDKKRILMPRKKRIISEAQKAQLGERMRKLHAASKLGNRPRKNNNFGHVSEGE